MKVQKFLPAVIGALLVILGCSVLFDSLNVSPRLWMLPVIGAAVLVVGVQGKNVILRDIGLAALILGAASLLDAFLLHPKYSSPLYYGAISVVLFCLAGLHKNSWSLLLGFVSAAIAVLQILQRLNLPEQLTWAYTLILVATAFVILFIVKNEKLGYIPLVLGILCYLLSVPCFLQNAGYIGETLALIIMSCLLIAAGCVIMVWVYKSGEKENKSE